MAECPLCGDYIERGRLLQHVNACLDRHARGWRPLGQMYRSLLPDWQLEQKLQQQSNNDGEGGGGVKSLGGKLWVRIKPPVGGADPPGSEVRLSFESTTKTSSQLKGTDSSSPSQDGAVFPTLAYWAGSQLEVSVPGSTERSITMAASIPLSSMLSSHSKPSLPDRAITRDAMTLQRFRCALGRPQPLFGSSAHPPNFSGSISESSDSSDSDNDAGSQQETSQRVHSNASATGSDADSAMEESKMPDPLDISIASAPAVAITELAARTEVTSQAAACSAEGVLALTPPSITEQSSAVSVAAGNSDATPVPLPPAVVGGSSSALLAQIIVQLAGHSAELPHQRGPSTSSNRSSDITGSSSRNPAARLIPFHNTAVLSTSGRVITPSPAFAGMAGAPLPAPRPPHGHLTEYDGPLTLQLGLIQHPRSSPANKIVRARLAPIKPPAESGGWLGTRSISVQLQPSPPTVVTKALPAGSAVVPTVATVSSASCGPGWIRELFNLCSPSNNQASHTTVTSAAPVSKASAWWRTAVNRLASLSGGGCATIAVSSAEGCKSQQQQATPLAVHLQAIYVPLSDVVGSGGDASGVPAPSWTPLHRAAADGNTELLKSLIIACGPAYLLARTQPPTSTNKPAGSSTPGLLRFGHLTVLDVAILCRQPSAVNTILAIQPPSPRVSAPARLHALHYAVLSGDALILKRVAEEVLQPPSRKTHKQRDVALRALAIAEGAAALNYPVAWDLYQTSLRPRAGSPAAGDGDDVINDPEEQERQINAMVARWAKDAEGGTNATLYNGAPSSAPPPLRFQRSVGRRNILMASAMDDALVAPPALTPRLSVTSAPSASTSVAVVTLEPATSPAATSTAVSTPVLLAGVLTPQAALKVYMQKLANVCEAVPTSAAAAAADGTGPRTLPADKRFVSPLSVSTILGAKPSSYGALDVPDKLGRTPLAYAVALGNLGALRYLLRKGCFPGAADEDGDTPLMIALRCGHVDIALYLLARVPPGVTWGQQTAATATVSDTAPGASSPPASRSSASPSIASRVSAARALRSPSAQAAVLPAFFRPAARRRTLSRASSHASGRGMASPSLSPPPSAGGGPTSSLADAPPRPIVSVSVSVQVAPVPEPGPENVIPAIDSPTGGALESGAGGFTVSGDDDDEDNELNSDSIVPVSPSRYQAPDAGAVCPYDLLQHRVGSRTAAIVVRSDGAPSTLLAEKQLEIAAACKLSAANKAGETALLLAARAVGGDTSCGPAGGYAASAALDVLRLLVELAPPSSVPLAYRPSNDRKSATNVVSLTPASAEAVPQPGNNTAEAIRALQSDTCGETPLHAAAKRGCIDAVRILCGLHDDAHYALLASLDVALSSGDNGSSGSRERLTPESQAAVQAAEFAPLLAVLGWLPPAAAAAASSTPPSSMGADGRGGGTTSGGDTFGARRLTVLATDAAGRTPLDCARQLVAALALPTFPLSGSAPVSVVTWLDSEACAASSSLELLTRLTAIESYLFH